MASKPKRSDFGAGRQGAARYQQALRKWKGAQPKPVKAERKTGGQGGTKGRTTRQTRGKGEKITPGSNPLQIAKPTKPGQSAYREEQEARRKAGKSYNPNNKPRKPSVEPGTNPLSRAIRARERAEQKAAAERAARRGQSASNKPAKPSKPDKTKSSTPNPRMTGEGAPRPKAGDKSSTAKKVSRLAKALSDKKGMRAYMDRLRKKK